MRKRDHWRQVRQSSTSPGLGGKLWTGLTVPLWQHTGRHVLWWDVDLTCVKVQERVAELQVSLGKQRSGFLLDAWGVEGSH